MAVNSLVSIMKNQVVSHGLAAGFVSKSLLPRRFTIFL